MFTSTSLRHPRTPASASQLAQRPVRPIAQAQPTSLLLFIRLLATFSSDNVLGVTVSAAVAKCLLLKPVSHLGWRASSLSRTYKPHRPRQWSPISRERLELVS